MLLRPPAHPQTQDYGSPTVGRPGEGRPATGRTRGSRGSCALIGGESEKVSQRGPNPGAAFPYQSLFRGCGNRVGREMASSGFVSTPLPEARSEAHLARGRCLREGRPRSGPMHLLPRLTAAPPRPPALGTARGPSAGHQSSSRWALSSRGRQALEGCLIQAL